jgi:putative Mg2+ transporter-C (MgtC) family protein
MDIKMLVLKTVLRSLTAIIVGCIIGSERARHSRAAGMRTHILVCLGACITSITSVFAAEYLGSTGDITRLSAQVVSGIGFLGVGMIIVKNNNIITGLTTAAGVWTTAIIGIAIGYGFYIVSAIVTALLLVALIVVAQFEKKRKNVETMYVELDNLYKVNVTLKILEEKIPIGFSYQVVAPKSGHPGNVGLSLLINGKTEINPDALCKIETVVFVAEA